MRLPRFIDPSTLPDRIDFIYHLASYGNLHSQTDSAAIFQANLRYTFDLLEATKNKPYQKFVYVSSSSVNLPKQTLYSACKKACEELTRAYDKPIIIVRPFSVTGVGEQKEHLIPTLIDAAFTGKTIPFVPEPVHDYIAVEDVAFALIDITNPRIYEIGSTISYSNLDVLDLVELMTGKKIKVKPVNQLRVYDTNSWKSKEDWSIQSLARIIERMVDDYQQKLKA